jgi:crotonobetainyl-CoA:carnitine CoA-transferase CaiB-like acyl-CoA transferase
MATSSSVGPLSHVTVLEVAQFLAGPYIGQLLGDLGANVIKIELPGTGEATRTLRAKTPSGETTTFLALNRNKRSVTIDLRRPEGQATVRRLASQADVLTENFRPGTMATWRLDYPTLREVNPRLIYCSVSMFGQSGPYSHLPGVDPLAQAVSGMMGLTGEENGPPVMVGAPIVDWGAATMAAYGVMAALYIRERTGAGQYLDVSLLRTAMAATTPREQEYLMFWRRPPRMGTSHRDHCPYQIVTTADGYIYVVTIRHDDFARLCEVLQRPDLAADARFCTREARVAHRQELILILNAIFRKDTTASWCTRLRQADVMCAPVHELPETYADPQVQHDGMVWEVDHPTAGRLRVLGTPVHFHATPAGVHRPPPLLGQHTEAILHEAGYSAEEIAALRQQGVV